MAIDISEFLCKNFSMFTDNILHYLLWDCSLVGCNFYDHYACAVVT